MNKDNYFLLYSDCIPVLGMSNSIIMDLQRIEYYDIPNLICEILILNRKKQYSLEKLKEIYKNKYDNGIDSFFAYFVEKELGFFTDKPTLFPLIQLNYNSPFKILTGIISYDTSISLYNLKDALNQFSFLGCQSLQMRIYKKINISFLVDIMKSFIDNRINTIEMFLENYNYSMLELTKLIECNIKIKLIIHSHNENLNTQRIKFTTQKINHYPKEIISKKLFTCNTMFYIESYNFNIGLNRKICIDHRGNIKRFINHKKSFGNIINTKLLDVLESEKFKKIWTIKNDDIEICKKCQYRYMCLSNSDIEHKNGKYYKINYCNIDI